MKTTPIELVCVGNYGLCWVTWHEVLVNDEKKKLGIVCHSAPLKTKRREQRLNYMTFDVPEGVVCRYNRYVCVKPQTYEERWFKVQDGQFVDLGSVDRNSTDYAQVYLQEFIRSGYDIISSNNPDIVKRHVDGRKAMLDPGAIRIGYTDESA